MTPAVSFESSLPTIEAILEFIVRRQRLSRAEAEEFASLVRLRLLEDDCQVLRRFGGRSTLRTYLGIVIERLFLDFRRSMWGKWRPSAEARRLGPVAERLDLLLSRDRLSLDEACATLRTTFGVCESEQTLHELSQRLRPRRPRHFVGVEVLEGLASVEASLETIADADEHGRRAARTRDALARALGGFSREDRLVIQLRFLHGMRVADIARGYGFEQKALYRRIDRLLRGLRRALEADGIDRAYMCDWLGRPDSPEVGHVLQRLPDAPEPSGAY